MLFVDGDKVRRVRDLQKHGKLEGVALEALPDGMEFEDIVPIDRYLDALATELGASSPDVRISYKNFIAETELPPKMMFSKRVGRWLDANYPDFVFEKPQVMAKAIENSDSSEIRCDELRSLVKKISQAVAQSNA